MPETKGVLKMITTLSLRNFKAFSKIDDLQIKPITVLTGVNSSGKSCILHSLLLLKQSLESDIKGEALLLEGPYLQYSHLREIAFGLPQTAGTSIFYDLGIETADGTRHVRLEFRHKKIPGRAAEEGTVINLFEFQLDQGNNYASFRLRSGKYSWPRNLRPIRLNFPDGYEPEKSERVIFDKFLPKYIERSIFRKSIAGEPVDSDRILAQLPVEAASAELMRLISKIRREISNIRYLGPVRAKPRRAYVHYSAARYDLDEDGANAAHIFWLRRNEIVKWKGIERSLSEALTDCLNLLGLKQNVSPRQSSRIVYQLEVETFVDNSKKVTIADVGFGYSQVLPILLRGLLSPKEALIMFEQPEIHLHPSCRANLADFFIELMKSGRRILLETHSTEIIDRLRLRSIENQELGESINVVFVEPPKVRSSSGSTIKQLTLNSDGMFDEWPDGFCDESQKLASDLIRARTKKVT